ncbi:uncharacterized protein LOC126315450 [Schistocerca gregaria]|uniref:uncharacterized protein LOC126315450 n=1 Tax=Schistocerca gregaria TaxID=7010 RepID=UPI00211EB72C|nr:uncharacterized protein LOC126315450 [Schistocerca gregaria]
MMTFAARCYLGRKMFTGNQKISLSTYKNLIGVRKPRQTGLTKGYLLNCAQCINALGLYQQKLYAAFIIRPMVSSSRAYSTISEIQVEFDSEHYKFTITLHEEIQTICLKEGQKVKHLIDAICKAYPSTKNLMVLSASKERLALSSPITVMVDGNDAYTLEIDNISYPVKPVCAIKQSHADSLTALKKNQTLQNCYDYVEKLKSQNVKKVALEDYLIFTKNEGLDTNDSLECLHTLHSHGVVLLFQNHPELGNTIILNLEEISTTLLHSLESLRQHHSTPEETEKYMLESEQLGKQYRINAEIKAKKYTTFFMYVILCGLIFQSLLFARLTWWDYSWNEIEPITYFVSVMEMIMLRYLYYLIRRKDYSNRDLNTWIYDICIKRQLKK